jgi:intracellular multiplication protein IcmP
MATSAHSGGAPENDHTGYSLIVIVAGSGVLCWAAWYFHHREVSQAAMEVAHWQMQAIHQFTDRFDRADAQVLTANPARVTFDQLVRLFREIGRFFLYPAMGLSLFLAALCFRRAAAARFTRALDLEGLMAEQAKGFRSTAAFVGRRLGLSAIRKGEPRPGDAALNMVEWVAAWASGKNGAFDALMARKELARQLGEVWRGIDQARPHVRCMLAVMALHHAHKRSEAIALLGDLAESLPKRKHDGRAGPEKALSFPADVVALADGHLSDKSVITPVLEVMGRHFFTTTGLMSVLCEARLRGGVLAPAQFAFLKLVDRRLWYALHSLGFEIDGPRAHPHPSQRIEAIGARDHWAAERLVGRPAPAPSVDRAIKMIRLGHESMKPPASRRG